MYISKITSYDKDDMEADVYVTDGRYTIRCYVYPTPKGFEKKAIALLFGYGVSQIYLSRECDFDLEKVNSFFAYRITGYVESVSGRIVKIGEIRIEIDSPFPGGIKEGDYVQLLVERCDVIWQR